MTDTSLVVHELPLEMVRENPANPRGYHGDLTDLVGSIRQYGVLQPIVAVADSKGWIAVAGSRRVRAAKEAGLDSIPAVVRELSKTDRDTIALVENVVRLQMSPVEEALAYARMMKERGLNQRQLSEALQISQARISYRLVLLKLPPDRIQMVHEGKLSVAQAVEEARSAGSKIEGGRKAQQTREKKKPRGHSKLVHLRSGHIACDPRACEVRQMIDKEVADGWDPPPGVATLNYIGGSYATTYHASGFGSVTVGNGNSG